MEKGGGSRLLQMQARFQQKQLQEREMKIASLYEAQQARALDRVRHSPSNGISVVTSPPQPPQPVPQPGKVRQMFEERRTKAGIDKSYPLQPIHNTEQSTRKALPNGYTKVSNSTSNMKVTTEKRTTKTHTSVSSHSIKKQLQINNIGKIVNGAGDLNHNHESDLNSVEHAAPQTNGAVTPSIDEIDKNGNDLIENETDKCNNDMLENETFPEALEPMPTPRTPEPVVATKPRSPEPQTLRQSTQTNHPPRRNSPVKTSPGSTKPQRTPVTAARKVASENVVSENSKARGAMQKGATPVTKRPLKASSGSVTSNVTKARGRSAATAPGPAPASPATGGGSGASAAACDICGRHFAPDRVAKHQEICKKAHTKKRKPFDVLKHRLAGTEAEPFINKLRKSTATPSTTKVKKTLNSNWRQKHEEFIQAIRAAKQVQAHLNAGGKLSDLPPPPPSENPDYVPCPHCNRRFNQGAAERHIPKCANYQFNKPKGNKTVKRR